MVKNPIKSKNNNGVMVYGSLLNACTNALSMCICRVETDACDRDIFS